MDKLLISSEPQFLHVQNRDASPGVALKYVWKEGKGEEGRRDEGEREVRDMGREGRKVSTFLISEGSVKYKHLTWHLAHGSIYKYCPSFQETHHLVRT